MREKTDLVGDTSVWVNLLQDLVNVGRVSLFPSLVALLLLFAVGYTTRQIYSSDK